MSDNWVLRAKAWQGIISRWRGDIPATPSWKMHWTQDTAKQDSRRQLSGITQKSNQFFCRIPAIFSRGHYKLTFLYLLWMREGPEGLISEVPALHSLPPKLNWNSWKPSTTKTEICSWPFTARLRINDNRLADFEQHSSKHICAMVLMQILPSPLQLKCLLAILWVFLHNLFIHSLRTLTNSLFPFKGLLSMWWINLSLPILNLPSVLIAAGSCIHGNFSALRID